MYVTLPTKENKNKRYLVKKKQDSDYILWKENKYFIIIYINYRSQNCYIEQMKK